MLTTNHVGKIYLYVVGGQDFIDGDANVPDYLGNGIMPPSKLETHGGEGFPCKQEMIAPRSEMHSTETSIPS